MDSDQYELLYCPLTHVVNLSIDLYCLELSENIRKMSLLPGRETTKPFNAFYNIPQTKMYMHTAPEL